MDDCVRPKKHSLVALRPSVISLLDYIDTKEKVYDHAYDLAAVVMAWKTMKAVTWAAVPPFPAAQSQLHDYAR